MKSKLAWATRIAAFSIGIGLTAMQLSAQQGTFNLPVKAHWGTALLEPGKHAVETPMPTSQTLVYLRSGDKTQIEVPLTQSSASDSNRSYLHLTKVNGEYYVDRYESGMNGKTFYFRKPKAVRGGGSNAESDETTLVNVDQK